MKEFLKIRVPKACINMLPRTLGFSFKRVGKRPYEQYDLELPLNDERWVDVKMACLKTATPSLFRIGRMFKDARRLPASRDIGYTIIDYFRVYSKQELEAASCFHVNVPIRAILDRNVDQEAKIYHSEKVCRYCRHGWRQKNDLTFNPKSLVQSYPFFRVFGRNEWIVNESVKNIFEKEAFKGVTFRQVRNIKSDEIIGGWFQIRVDRQVSCLPDTLFGFDPLYTDPRDSQKCPNDHTNGLNLISEIFLDRNSMKNTHVAMTTNLLGGLGAIQLPTSMLVVSRGVFLALSQLIPKAKLRYEVVNIK